MERIFVSACLLGERVRSHGDHAPTDQAILGRWMAEGRIVLACSEMAARQLTSGLVDETAKNGVETTAALLEGARIAVQVAQSLLERFEASSAVANSPPRDSAHNWDWSI